MLKYGIGDVVIASVYVGNGVYADKQITITTIALNDDWFVSEKQYYIGICDDNKEYNVFPDRIRRVVFSRKYKIGQSVRAHVYNENVKTENKTRYGIIIGYEDDNTALIRFGVDKPIPVAISAIADKYENALCGYRYGLGASYHWAGIKSKRVNYKFNGRHYFIIKAIYMKDGRTAYDIESHDKAIKVRGVRMSEIY